MIGDFIGPSIVALVARAREYRETVWMDFNGTPVYADRKSNPARLSTWWKEQQRQKSLAYWASPEGVAQAEQDRIAQLDREMKTERLVSRLYSLDFTDLEELMSYFEQMESSAGLGWFNRRKVVKVFKQHGFRANENLGDKLDEGDRENMARYLIGQALDSIRGAGAIPGAYTMFLEQWRERFTPSPVS